MYLAELDVKNFRKLKQTKICFQPGLNILIGANNVGKTAVVDALRALLAGHEEPYPRLRNDDQHRPKAGVADGPIIFKYIFRDLSEDDEADFLAALQPGKDGNLEAHITVRYADPDGTGRLRPNRWCGEHEEVSLTSEMMENLRGVYLPPLRDAAQDLRPSRTSQLARLLHIVADDPGRDSIESLLKELDKQLKDQKPIVSAQAAVSGRHGSMVGSQLAQALEVGLSTNDFQRLSARLSLLVDNFDIEQNGLGFNNLIFMAVVLSELAKNPDVSYRGLIIEEPEAHLHPQLQAVLLRYLESIKAASEESAVQIFVTSHSPNFASIAKLDCLSCLVETDDGVETFSPRSINFKPGSREKLERYLDVTRAELFFAKRVIFVEGAAEFMMLSILAHKAGINLREASVSLINVEGLNFDCFLPLFGAKALRIPVSVITDADPQPMPAGDGSPQPVYPSIDDQVEVSDHTTGMKKYEDGFIRVFHGVKTFEYDLALHATNRVAMVKALIALHPIIGAQMATAVEAASTEAEKAKALYCGMFERSCNNVQKGRYGQALAQALMESSAQCEVPKYILQAFKHVCESKPVHR